MLLSCGLYTQDFSFEMCFEDAEGNRDTLIIGYDTYGSRDTINPDFGEENIADIPFDSVFDVRITNQVDINGANWDYDYELYHSKKKIVEPPVKSVNIDIHAIHWPVTASWNPELFDNPELNGSLFTPLHGQFWWDMINHFSNFDRIVLHEQDYYTFTANYPDNWEEYSIDYDGYCYCYYIDNEGKPIATYWVVLGDSTLLTLDTDEHFLYYENIQVYPNPTNGLINIEWDEGFSELKSVMAYDITGKAYYINFTSNTANIKPLEDGVYLLEFTFMNGKSFIRRVIKNSTVR